MHYRSFGRTGWQISEIGFGMWGMGGPTSGWTGSDDEESMRSLERAVQLGCNFFDTAWAYGNGHSERLLGKLLANHKDKQLYTATKIPPKNGQWPARPEYTLDEVFPPDHIRKYAELSLKNLAVDKIDLLQFHVWSDRWNHDVRWQRAVDDLKRENLVTAFGLSINRWEPENGIQTLQSGSIDAVQVIYNVFDQAPEDRLFPVCRDLNIGVIARVPFDEGSLTGNLTLESKWPEGDFRTTYFGPENLAATVKRADALKRLLADRMSMPELALRFILSNADVSTTIPGMRTVQHVESNIVAGDRGGLPHELIAELRAHRWDRKPAWWSD
jgi:aryl-alcohol dehydrogenase-like predicted oxidoreductase